ncbi:hypothetical protein GGR57DRAFT_341918 [Xylariaceae sp. FL1272]|nr:hypothetical protein GGR57DRAFT_341918 [Xylariaceae sp. FL1272]
MHAFSLATWAITASLLPSIEAISFYTNATLPANISSACTSALISDIASCDPVVPALRNGAFYSESTLTRICTTACASSLAVFQGAVDRACSADVWTGYDDEPLPVAVIPELLRYQFNLTCLENDGLFCNNVAASYASFLDPNATMANAPASGQFGDVNVTDSCDLCLVKNLQFQAGSPYYDGPMILAQSIYQSKTSSCGIKNMDITPTALTVWTPTSTGVEVTPTCAGETYEIRASDDCHLIAESQGISTSWLLQDNQLKSGCADFPASGSLCLAHTCEVYTVVANDTCESVSRAHNVTEAQFRAWNPNIDAGCYNIDRMIGDQLCIGSPGTPYVAPPHTSLAQSTATTPAPVPTDVADETNKDCGLYYRVEKGDYCNLVILKFGITLPDFVFLNPAINENCTNLFADESYCVQAVGDINTYSGRPGYVSYTATITSLNGDPATRWPEVTYTTPTTPSVTTSELPLATDTRTDCFQYFKASSYIGKVTEGSLYRSDCDLAAFVFMVSLEDLGVWNPSLGNTSLPTCTFVDGQRYCGRYWEGDVAPVIEGTGGGSPIRDNTTSNCTEYVDVFDGSGYTCQDILTFYDITIAQFYNWNPAVGSDCGNLWTGYQYCVAIPGSGDPTSTPSTTTPTPTNGPGAPTQTGQPSNCVKWYIVKDGDSCPSVENAFFITSAQFLEWNPSVSEDCAVGFWLGYAYCVGTTDSISTTRVTATATPTPTPTGITAPDPHQDNNAVSNCNKFGQAQDGDYCSLFAERNGITTGQLFAWNAVLGSDGAGCDTMFWKDYWYCVGVSS